MEMLRLTMAYDGSLALVNPLQIKAVCRYFGEDTTIVDYSGNEGGYIEVKESVEAIDSLLKNMIEYERNNGVYIHKVALPHKASGKHIPKGEWLRMSDLSEKDDNRYKCSRCGNVVHHKSRMDLYTFNSWCGRCGSDNSRHITTTEVDKSSDVNG